MRRSLVLVNVMTTLVWRRAPRWHQSGANILNKPTISTGDILVVTFRHEYMRRREAMGIVEHSAL